jgi:predicted Holliday junction resolvase-like endonuclease
MIFKSIVFTLLGVFICITVFLLFKVIHLVSDLDIFKKKIKQMEDDIDHNHKDIDMVERTLKNQIDSVKEGKKLLKG